MFNMQHRTITLFIRSVLVAAGHCRFCCTVFAAATCCSYLACIAHVCGQLWLQYVYGMMLDDDR